jgi:hypothetical protein
LTVIVADPGEAPVAPDAPASVAPASAVIPAPTARRRLVGLCIRFGSFVVARPRPV